MSKDASYYAIIPANVRYDKQLCPNAKLLYGEISALCKKEGYCWSNNDYFAELYNVSKKSVSTWIGQLVSSEYIHKKLVYKDGTKEILMRKLYLSDGYKIQKNDEEKFRRGTEEKFLPPTEEKFLPPTEEKVIDNNTISSLIIQGGMKGENVQLPHPNLVPNNLESDGTKIPSEPLVVENHSKSEIGGYSKSIQASKAPQPPDVKKVARDINEILRKKFPKDEMDIILDTSTLDLPTISEMFAEYWVYQVNRPFNKDHTSNLFSSFRYWIKIAKDKEIPAKETTSGIKSRPIMEKVLHEVGKRKRMTLSPTDAGKVNKFIAESGVSDKALEHGTKNFCNGSGNTWDGWMVVVGNAIKSEKLGEI